jgi:hypothetical protein
MRVRKGLAQPQAWQAGDVSTLPEQGEAGELAGVTRTRASQAFERKHTHVSVLRKHTVTDSNGLKNAVLGGI